MSKVIVYCRVSTEKQEVEGTSLDTQQEACFAKAQDVAGPGDEITLLRETCSGLSLQRPELDKLREWVRHGQVKAVVSYSCDRLSRDGLHLLLVVDEIEKAGAKVVFVTEPHEGTPEGQLLTYVRGWASKLEALRIKERTVRGRKQRARKGRMPTNGNLYGYLFTKGKGEGRGIRIPDIDKGKTVRDIFNWYTSEVLSLEVISKRLHALGIASPTGQAYWRTSTVLRILTNVAYTGRTITQWTFGGHDEAIEVPGATPALIDQAVFGAAQERMRLNKENAKRRGKRDYLLRGLLFCECGRRMQGHAHNEWREYRCGAIRDPKTPCSRAVNADAIEKGVWAEFKVVLSNPDLIKAQMTEQHGSGQDTAELEAQIRTIDARLKAMVQGEAAVVRQLRQGLVTEEMAAKELRQGQQERTALEREKGILQGQLESVKGWTDIDIEGLCRSARENLEAPTPQIQRLALEAFGTKIALRGQQVEVSVALPVEPSDRSFVLQSS